MELKMAATLEIRSDLQTKLGVLATETHRSESELMNEALESYLQRTQIYITKLQQRVAAADAGEFASDEETERFFLTHGES
jgi:predicted transcriptional regulator